MSKKQSIVFFAFLIFWNYSKCQKLDFIKYFNIANEAEYLLNTGNTKIAKWKLLNLETQYKILKPREYLYLGVLYYLDSDTLTGNKYLEKSANKLGFKPSVELKSVKNIFPEFSISYYSYNLLKEVEKKEVEKAKAIYKSSIADSILYYTGIDAALRGDDVSIMYDSTASDSILQVIKEILIKYPDFKGLDPDADYNNQRRCLNYLKRYGLPDPFLYNIDFISIFYHVDDDRIFKEYKTFLMNELKKGAICPCTYASMIDRKQHYDGKPTIYGHFTKENEKIVNSVITKKRMSIGHPVHYQSTWCEFPNFKTPDRKLK